MLVTRYWMAVFIAASWVFAGAAEPQTYRVVSEESRFEVHVGRAGLLKMFGHDHVIAVGAFTGTAVWDDGAPERSRFELEIDAASLVVADEDISDEDRVEIQATMESEALALSQNPTIRFESSSVVVDEDRAEIRGTLDLRGVQRELELSARISVEGDRLVVRGEHELSSEDWGVPQISVAGGSVKTKNELGLEFEIVAER